jgi:hypothetical protein
MLGAIDCSLALQFVTWMSAMGRGLPFAIVRRRIVLSLKLIFSADQHPCGLTRFACDSSVATAAKSTRV